VFQATETSVTGVICAAARNPYRLIQRSFPSRPVGCTFGTGGTQRVPDGLPGAAIWQRRFPAPGLANRRVSAPLPIQTCQSRQIKDNGGIRGRHRIRRQTFLRFACKIRSRLPAGRRPHLRPDRAPLAARHPSRASSYHLTTKVFLGSPARNKHRLPGEAYNQALTDRAEAPPATTCRPQCTDAAFVFFGEDTMADPRVPLSLRGSVPGSAHRLARRLLQHSLSASPIELVDRTSARHGPHAHS